jgi:hypothetical protein
MAIDFDKTSETAGKLHQIACDAVQKALNKEVEKQCVELAYFDFQITLTWSELAANTFKPLRSIRVESEKCEDR